MEPTRIKIILRDEELIFTGELLVAWTDYTGDQFGTDWQLYKCPGGYRVYRNIWSRSSADEPERDLLPNNLMDLHTLDPDDPESSPPIHYGVYTENEARRRYPRLFMQAGFPNQRDLDQEMAQRVDESSK